MTSIRSAHADSSVYIYYIYIYLYIYTSLSIYIYIHIYTLESACALRAHLILLLAVQDYHFIAIYVCVCLRWFWLHREDAWMASLLFFMFLYTTFRSIESKVRIGSSLQSAAHENKRENDACKNNEAGRQLAPNSHPKFTLQAAIKSLQKLHSGTSQRPANAGIVAIRTCKDHIYHSHHNNWIPP